MSADESVYDPSSYPLSIEHSHMDTCAFTRIKNRTYLHGHDRHDVYIFLAHVLAVRAMDLHNMGINMDGTPYQRPLKKANLALQDLLIKAENVPNLLPATWDRDDCVQYCSATGWLEGGCEWVTCASDIKERWEDDDGILLKFRCLGEVIYGSAVDGEPLLDRMAALEAGEWKAPSINKSSQTSQVK